MYRRIYGTLLAPVDKGMSYIRRIVAGAFSSHRPDTHGIIRVVIGTTPVIVKGTIDVCTNVHDVRVRHTMVPGTV